MQKQLVKNKRGLIMGMANEYSIAYGIASALNTCCYELIFTAQNERFRQKITDIEIFKDCDIFTCDVSQPGAVPELFQKIGNLYGSIDFVVHSIAFSDRKELQGKYFDTSRENFLNAINISCYSFTEVCKYAKDVMPNGGSILTLSYYGAEKVVPNYNVMGVIKAALEASVRYLASDLGEFNIRVNAISAGPIKTLASSGVGSFSKILEYEQNRSPLCRNVTREDIGKACAFLLSDFASGITGEIVHVDCGCNTVGVKF